MISSLREKEGEREREEPVGTNARELEELQRWNGQQCKMSQRGPFRSGNLYHGKLVALDRQSQVRLQCEEGG